MSETTRQEAGMARARNGEKRVAAGCDLKGTGVADDAPLDRILEQAPTGGTGLA